MEAALQEILAGMARLASISWLVMRRRSLWERASRRRRRPARRLLPRREALRLRRGSRPARPLRGDAGGHGPLPVARAVRLLADPRSRRSVLARVPQPCAG